MTSLSSRRPTWAEIDLNKLAFNFHSIKNFVGNDVAFMGVVKADAYGHGAGRCAQRLEAEGADWLAVASAEEAVELRQNDITLPILVAGGFWPGQEDEFLNFDLTPVLFRTDHGILLDAAAKSRSRVTRVHIKLDTGMNRVGLRPEEWEASAAKLFALKNIEVEGLMTHFAAADVPSENAFTGRQIEMFAEAVEIFQRAGHRPKYLDMANSPGAVIHPLARSKMIRIGGLLYGLADDVIPPGIKKPVVKPVMSLFTKAALVKKVPKGQSIGYGRSFVTKRETVIATLPVGYHDGYRREMSNNGVAIVDEKLAPVVGRISMDWTTIDVTDCSKVNVGDKVTLIGEAGVEKVTAADLAAACGTISYEITCGIGPRVPRIYSSEMM